MLIFHFVRLHENDTFFLIALQLFIHQEGLSFLSPSNQHIVLLVVFLRFHDLCGSIFMECLELHLSIYAPITQYILQIQTRPKIQRVSLWLNP